MRVALNRLTLRNYKAFPSVELNLTRSLTVVMGKNNAGKSALVRSPIFATGGLDPAATALLPLRVRDEPFGDAFLDVAYNGALTGVEIGIEAAGVPPLHFHVTSPDPDSAEQIIAAVDLGASATARRRPAFFAVKDVLVANAAFARLAQGITWLTDHRRVVEETFADASLGVSPRGERTLALLDAARARRDTEGLAALDRWTTTHMGLTVELRRGDGRLRARARPTGSAITLPIDQVGAGFCQILPILAECLVRAPAERGHLLIVEQPELHLHPALHAEVAQLLVDAAGATPTRRILVETHSDAFVMRLRALVAEGTLGPTDVRLIFVEDGAARDISLDRHGMPDWWPSGVFFEPFEEYERLRRAAARALP